VVLFYYSGELLGRGSVRSSGDVYVVFSVDTVAGQFGLSVVHVALI
jgi:hypothetical protein